MRKLDPLVTKDWVWPWKQERRADSKITCTGSEEVWQATTGNTVSVQVVSPTHFIHNFSRKRGWSVSPHCPFLTTLPYIHMSNGTPQKGLSACASLLSQGPIKRYVTLFRGNLISTHPLVTLIMLNITPSKRFFPENLTPPPPWRYVTLEWPHKGYPAQLRKKVGKN